MRVCLPKVDLFAKTDYAALSKSNYVKAFNDQRKDKTFIGFTLTWNLFDGFTNAVVNTAAQRDVERRVEQAAYYRVKLLLQRGRK